jgi:flagellar basal body-associated protein FliL
MKQKDLILIVVIILVAAVASLLISNRIFVTSTDRQQQVEVVPPISANFGLPDPAYFNSNSKDPTQIITISPSNNPNPF